MGAFSNWIRSFAQNYHGFLSCLFCREFNLEYFDQDKFFKTFLTDESDDEDDEETEVGNLFDDFRLANEQHEIQTNVIIKYEEKATNNVKGCVNVKVRISFFAKQKEEILAKIEATTFHDIRSYYEVGKVRLSILLLIDSNKIF